MLPDRLSRLLTGFVDGQLSSQEQKQVAELLRRSAEARTLLHQLQADARLLGTMPRVQLPPEFAEQLQQRLPKRLLKIADRPTRPDRRLTWRQTSIFAAAATLLLAVGIAFLHSRKTCRSRRRGYWQPERRTGRNRTEVACIGCRGVFRIGRQVQSTRKAGSQAGITASRDPQSHANGGGHRWSSVGQHQNFARWT